MKVHQSVIPLRLIFSHVQWDAGRREDAVATLKAGISRNPQAFELQEVLVDYLAHKGDVARAQAAFKRLPRTAIDHARWHFLEGRVLMADQQWSRAAHSFEKASGFSGADAHVRHQSGICLAVCRREQGEREGSIDAWRNTLRADPTSSDSRLGMAAALLESGKMDLAIAEYRQLLEVKGVPELLASLLIRETLSQPRTRQNWQDLEQMLSDDDPIITNKTQRLFLQADLLFAKGYPARALRMLDVAAEDEPKNSRILSARRRLLEDKDGTIMRRMEDTLIGQPDSLEAHITILRLWSCRVGHESSGGWLTQLIAGNVYGQLPEQRRLMVGAQVAEAAAADFERTHEQASTAAMLVEAERVWNRLIEISPNLRAQAVAFIARHRDDESVRVALKQMPTETNSIVQTQCWLAALENTQRKEVLRVSAEQSLRRLVAAEPSNMQLRQAYVEYLIQFAEYKIALTIERQILQREPHNPEALSRCAWILTMVDGDHSEALALSERASRYAPVDTDVRTVRALVLARSSAPAEALPVFGSVPADARTPESFAYEALAWLRSGQQGEALRIVNDVVRQHKPERWRPADQSLLKQILRQAAAAADVVANRRPATELGIAVN